MAKRAERAKTPISKTKAFKSVMNKEGFTLLELIVVIFIVSLIMAIVMPSFYGIGEGTLKSEAKKLASLLRHLNDSAITRKDTFLLTLNLDAKTLNWETLEGKKGSERFKGIFKVSTTSKGDVLKGEVILSFSPMGLQENLTITLRDGDKEMAILFNPLSGRVKVR